MTIEVTEFLVGPKRRGIGPSAVANDETGGRGYRSHIADL
jgi:hypothetical protein